MPHCRGFSPGTVVLTPDFAIFKQRLKSGLLNADFTAGYVLTRLMVALRIGRFAFADGGVHPRHQGAVWLSNRYTNKLFFCW